MFKYPKFSVLFTCSYLLFFIALVPGNFSFTTTSLLFFLSPILVIWMVINVLKNPMGEVSELPDGREWGYQDRPDIKPEV